MRADHRRHARSRWPAQAVILGCYRHKKTAPWGGSDDSMNVLATGSRLPGGVALCWRLLVDHLALQRDGNVAYQLAVAQQVEQGAADLIPGDFCTVQ